LKASDIFWNFWENLNQTSLFSKHQRTPMCFRLESEEQLYISGGHIKKTGQVCVYVVHPPPINDFDAVIEEGIIGKDRPTDQTVKKVTLDPKDFGSSKVHLSTPISATSCCSHFLLLMLQILN